MIPGGLYLADTSAIARVADPAVHRELTRLGRLGLLATCVTVDLEVLYSARTPAEHATTAARRAAGFIDLPLNPEIGARAKSCRRCSPPAASIVAPGSSTCSPRQRRSIITRSFCITTATSTTSPQ
ncbi:MAG: hypothetical protein ACT4NP_04720 [Pseudonocardiales bacterium]